MPRSGVRTRPTVPGIGNDGRAGAGQPAFFARPPCGALVCAWSDYGQAAIDGVRPSPRVPVTMCDAERHYLSWS
jgi:hypothetical protein